MDREYWKSELLTPRELERHPELKGWSMWRINTLRSRYKLIPEPIIRPHLVPSRKDPTKTVSKGRSVFYLVAIVDYLKRIDYLRKAEKLSYREIANRDDIKKELVKFKLLKETELSIDSRIMDQGFYANFISARTNLAAFFKWPANSALMIFLNSIVKDRDKYARDYYQINKQMRQKAMEGRAISEELRKKKKMLGRRIDYIHSIMHVTVKEAVQLLQDKEITVPQWFAPIKKLDEE